MALWQVLTPQGEIQTFEARAAARAFARLHPGSKTSEYVRRITGAFGRGAPDLATARGHGKRQYIAWSWALGLRVGAKGKPSIHGVAHRDYTPPPEGPPPPLPRIGYVVTLLEAALQSAGDTGGVVVMTVDAEYLGAEGMGSGDKRGGSPSLTAPLSAQEMASRSDEPEAEMSGERLVLSERVAIGTIRQFLEHLRAHQSRHTDRTIDEGDEVGFTRSLRTIWPYYITPGTAYMVSFRRPIT